MKSFGELLNESWKEFKANFKSSSKLILFFIFIPSILLSILRFSLYSWTGLNELVYYSILGLVSLVVMFIGILASTGIYASVLFGKKKYKDALTKGKNFYWRYILFNIVLTIFLIGLFALLIIPGIIFSVFWVFAIFIFILEDKGIIDALKKSKKLVKGNWWGVLGYSILFGLIVFGISIIFSIPSWPTGIMVMLDATKNPYLYEKGASLTTIAIVHNNIDGFFQLLSKFVTLPLSIIFFKNFYLSMKKK